MPNTRLIRPALALALLALGSCAAAPPPEAPLQPGQAYYSQRCQAGFYQCNLPTYAAVGSQCSCPGLGAPSYGVVR